MRLNNSNKTKLENVIEALHSYKGFFIHNLYGLKTCINKVQPIEVLMKFRLTDYKLCMIILLEIFKQNDDLHWQMVDNSQKSK